MEPSQAVVFSRDGRTVTLGEVRDRLYEASRSLFEKGKPFVPGMASIQVRRKVRLGNVTVDGRDAGLWSGKSVEPGMYFMRSDDAKGSCAGGILVDGNGRDMTPALYVMRVPDQTKEQLLDVMVDGAPLTGGNGAPSLVLEITSIESDSGKPLTVLDVMVWDAVDTAIESGDEAMAEAILTVAYSRMSSGAGIAGVVASPTVHTQQISRLTQSMDKLPVDGKIRKVRVSPKDAQYEVSSKVKLEYRGTDELVVKGLLTRNDIRCNMAFGSIYRNAGSSPGMMVSAATVYRHMTGSNSKFVREEAKQKILDSVMFQRDVDLLADCTEEIGERRILVEDENGEQVEVSPRVIQERLLNVDPVVGFTKDGSQMLLFRINAEPPLMKHDRALRQLITFPQAVLVGVNHKVKQNDANAAIREYLMYRISRMDSGNSATNKIRYETVLEACGLADTGRTQRSRYTKAIGKTLDALKAEDWKVRRWREYVTADDKRRGRKATGVEITLLNAPERAKRKKGASGRNDGQ